MISHGLVSSGLFSLGNITYEKTGTRRLYLVKGVLNVMPIISFFWFILCIINIGAPPTINLFGEIILFIAILNISSYMGLLLGLSRFLAAGYSLYLYTVMHHGQRSIFINFIGELGVRNKNILFFHCFPVVIYIIGRQHLIL